jgi:hypothetical protein
LVPSIGRRVIVFELNPNGCKLVAVGGDHVIHHMLCTGLNGLVRSNLRFAVLESRHRKKFDQLLLLFQLKILG